jgi:putative nucleotidyltransferase with HDIG domain
MTHRESPIGTQRHALTRTEDQSVGRLLLGFVFLMLVVAAYVIARACADLPSIRIDYWLPALVVLTLSSGRLRIKVPGREATVSVSEVFVFAIMLQYGAAPATLIATVDGLWLAFTSRDRRLHRALFNVAEPAISTWVAGQVFFALQPLASGLSWPGALIQLLPAAGMTAVYCLLNSALTSVAVSLESGTSAYETWRRQTPLLAVNYFAAASFATLGASGATFDFAVMSLTASLMALSYFAYREAAARVEEAQRHVAEVERLYQATVETLAIAVDVKDQVTHRHVRRVQRHTVALARTLGVSSDIELKALEAASLLHDVGKIAVPDWVLNKPGSLNFAEYETIKLHALQGATILKAVGFPYPVVPIVKHHHEHWNGRGYPDGLAGESIPLGARILAVVDCFDALTSDRPYRRRLRDEEAIEILRSRSGTMYDSRIVDAFVELISRLRLEDYDAEEVPIRVDSVRARPGPADRVLMDGSAAERTMALARLRQVGTAALQSLVEELPDAEGAVIAVSSERDELHCACATPRLQTVVKSVSFLMGEGLSGWVAANRHTMVNSEADLDLNDYAIDLSLRSAASTPVFAFGTVAAVLTAYLPQRAAFSHRQVRLLGLLAQDIGHGLAREQAPQPEARPARPHLVAVSNLAHRA